MSHVPSREPRRTPGRPAALAALNALDLALASQELEAEAQECLLAFLPLLDGVEKLCRGLDRLAPEVVLQRAEGLALLAEVADTTLANLGLERLGRPGEAADSSRHEVVDTVPRTDLAHGTVLEVLQYGLASQDKVLRQARVVASVRSGG